MLKFDGSKKLKQFFSLFVVKFGYFEKKVKTQKKNVDSFLEGGVFAI